MNMSCGCRVLKLVTYVGGFGMKGVVIYIRDHQLPHIQLDIRQMYSLHFSSRNNNHRIFRTKLLP
jgi:hypothetical protein